MKIALVGFMGTGKTSVGEIISHKLDLKFIDTDTVIEEEVGKSIPAIFSHYGEKYFRRLEERVLEKIINKNDDFVLATGGGIVISPRNRELILNQTNSFLLVASPIEIYQRTRDDENRPLLASDKPLTAIKNLLKEREDYYNKFPVKIETEDKTPSDVARKIISLLKK